MVHRIHQMASARLLELLLLAYVCAALFPSFGAYVRTIHVISLPWMDGTFFDIKMSTALLALMVFNAGLSMHSSEIIGLIRRPKSMVVGLSLNIILPSTMIALVAFSLRFWPDAAKADMIVRSLAIVVAMPIAGASTAWAQRTNANLALSLGLVITSTLLSPLTNRIAMTVVEHVASHDASMQINALKNGSMGVFLTYIIVVPSILGLTLKHYITRRQGELIKSPVKSLNLGILLFLNYSNAATSLPSLIQNPDWVFLTLVGTIVTTMCVTSFYLGWTIPKFFGISKSERIATMYALGMNNNGSALVVVAVLFAKEPLLMLPIIAYNLVQHIVAGLSSVLVLQEQMQAHEHPFWLKSIKSFRRAISF